MLLVMFALSACQSKDSYVKEFSDFVDKVDACAVIRGLRTAADFEYELPLAQTNRHLNAQVDTVFLATSPEHSYISSSGVKEIIQFGGDITGLVPPPVQQFLLDRNTDNR